MTTTPVGYGDTYPMATAGRFIGAVIMGAPAVSAVGMIDGMTAIPATDGQPTAEPHLDRAARWAAARLLIRDAAAGWLTEATLAAVGQAVAVSITRHRAVHRQQPTWAEALAGIDPDLLTPLTVPPDGWPLPPAVWRRELRARLMSQLKHTGWVAYTSRPRSLQVGSRGRAWLTVTDHSTPG